MWKYTSIAAALCFMACAHVSTAGMRQGPSVRISTPVDDGNLISVENGYATDLGFGPEDILVSQSDVGPYAVNPDTLLDMIYTNAASIESGSGRTPETFVEIYATSNSPTLNGSNLWNAVTDACTNGSDLIVMLDPGTYALPESLIISNAHIEIISIVPSTPVEAVVLDVISSAGTISPSHVPQTVITGNIEILDDADRCVVKGVTLADVTLNEYADSYKDRLAPSSLINCLMTNALLCYATTNALRLDGCYIEGSYSSATNAISGGDVCSSVIVHNGDTTYRSLSFVRGIDDQPFSKPIQFIDSYFQGCKIGLDFKSALAIDGCVIYGSKTFALASATAVSESVKVYNSRFDGSSTFAGVEDSISTEFRNCIGVSASIINHASTVFTFCTDSTGAVIE